MWWDDPGPEDEGLIRRLSASEMMRRIGARLAPERGALARGFLLLLVSVAAELAGPIVLRQIIDIDIPRAADQGEIAGIVRSALIYLGVFLFGSLASYFQVIVIARMGLTVIARLKQDTFDHLLALGADYFDHHPPGRLMARVESDAERLQHLFSEVTMAISRSLLLLGGTFTVMMMTNSKITLIVMAVATPFCLLAFLFLRYMRGLYAKVRKIYTRLNTFVAEYVQGVPILQVYGRQRWAMDRLARRNEERYRIEVGTEFLNYGYWGLFSTLEVFAVMLILYLGFGSSLGGGLTLGTLILFVEYTRRLFWPLVHFAEQLNFIQKAFASADRVFGILDTESTVRNREGARPALPEGWSEIRFEEVVFDYPPPDETGSAVRALDGISFRVQRGERIALVGPSGGGKSTITSLMLRFYEPTSGRITIDGVDIREYSLIAWRSQLGLVLQDIHLFPGTMAENLRVFSDTIPDQRLADSVRAIGAEEMIRALPLGMETQLAEGGQNLSMGQRQMICFSRAMVKDPQVLILDEATSSVDPATERTLQTSLARMMSGRTSVVVAHRLSTVTSADRILVVQHGKIVQSGSHRALLEEAGLYRALYDLQFQAGEVR